jgi:hypothetical protein
MSTGSTHRIGSALSAVNLSVSRSFVRSFSARSGANSA